MLQENNLEFLFPSDRFTLLETGQSYIRTVHTLPTGEVVEVPAFYGVFRQRQSEA
jgi:hypothetical protein